MRNRDDESDGDDDDDDAVSLKARYLSAEPDSMETCKLLFSGRFCRNSAQAGEDWKFFKSSSVRQTNERRVGQKYAIAHFPVPLALTNNVGSLLGVFDQSS